MSFKIIDIQEDHNMGCYSVLTSVSIGEFVSYIQPIHEEKGNIDEQREVLQTRSAKIIRKQMIEDLQQGGILPPIVLGNLCEEKITQANFEQIIQNTENISILDGMQRIEALKQANIKDANHLLRVEFWFAKEEKALLYRMLILNSGQIPWGLEKQLEVVFKPIIKKIQKQTTQTHKNIEIVDLFLAFASRKVLIDKRQQLAEYHAALDIMALIRHKDGQVLPFFEKIFVKLVQFEEIFKPIPNYSLAFSHNTAQVGFMVACAEEIFGLLGNGEKNTNEIEENFDRVNSEIQKLIDQNTAQEVEKLDKFLGVEVLKEQLKMIPKEKHRKAFSDGFRRLFKGDQIDSLAVCWNKMY